MTLPLDQVIVGDCLKVLRGLPANSIDVCFADPPFNLEKKYGEYEDARKEKKYLKWCKDWMQELVRVTKPEGSIFLHNIPKWLTHYAKFLNKHAYFRHWISWDALSTPIGKTLMPAHYGILFYTKGEAGFKFHEVRAPHKLCRLCKGFLKDWGGKVDQRHPFGYLVSDVWTDIHRIKHKKRRDEHPCQLPVHLLERIILMSTDSGDVVLDPFLGTGTTAVAAKRLGRRFIGIELDRKYAEIAEEKLCDVTESKFKGVYVSQYLGNMQTIRDVDAKTIFPPQLTKQKKRILRERSNTERTPKFVAANGN